LGCWLAPAAGLKVWIFPVELVLDCVKESCDIVDRYGLLLSEAIHDVLVSLAQIADAI
jgi:hypothetical protein